MKKVLFGTMAALFVVLPLPAEGPPVLDVRSEAKNPWTHLSLDEDPELFRFAIVSDRSALPREGVFAEAVRKLNLLRPDFVMSIGDFVGGFTFQGRVTDAEAIEHDWQKVESILQNLEPPFFYVVGNNDINSEEMEPLWRKRFGRKYYHFVYKNVLFLALDSDDPPGSNDGGIGQEQLAWLEKTLDEHSAARWTLLFVHRPLWDDPERPDWGRVEELLGERPATVFAGHLHYYKKTRAHGRTYYTLATTGGLSDLTGPAERQFDHVAWVTMTRSGPRVANLMLEGIWGDDPPSEAAQGSRDAESPR